MKKQKLYCFGREAFIRYMQKSGWDKKVPFNVAVISIDSVNETDEHFYKEPSENILNIDFCDMSPELWWHEDLYDIEQEKYLDHLDKGTEYDPSAFIFNFGPEKNNASVYALNYKQAGKIVEFIDKHINCDFYIHCAAGVSRSQAVVRYILDIYFNHDWITRKENPCVCPNIHVVRMLKRCHYIHEPKFNNF